MPLKGERFIAAAEIPDVHIAIASASGQVLPKVSDAVTLRDGS